MSPTTSHYRSLFLVAAIALANSPVIWAGPSADAETGLDKLEMKIELRRHERLLATQRVPNAVLAPFVSDGCSGGLSSVWQMATSAAPALAARHGEHPPWESCCTTHDQLYHSGVSAGADARTSFEARRHADEELRLCVRKIGSDRAAPLAAEYGIGQDEVELIYSGIADFMYRAVRLGGAPCTGLPWRWGFGWPNCQ